MFRAERIGQAIWPEVTGVAVGIGAQLAASSIDTAVTAWEQPVFQYAATGFALIGGGWMVATGTAPEFATGLLLGGITMVGVNLARSLYEQVTRAAVRQRPIDFAALAPRRVGVALPPGGGGLQERLLLRERAAAERQGAAVGASRAQF